MMKVIGIGEYAITNNPEASIVTHALGSCVAVVIHCTVTGYTAMAHVVLPKKSRVNQPIKEAYYADTTLKGLLNYFLHEKQCKKAYLKVHLIGGADAIHPDDHFQVGKKNVVELINILNSYQIPFDASDTGGHYSRTVSVRVKNGKIKVHRNKMII